MSLHSIYFVSQVRTALAKMLAFMFLMKHLCLPCQLDSGGQVKGGLWKAFMPKTYVDSFSESLQKNNCNLQKCKRNQLNSPDSSFNSPNQISTYLVNFFGLNEKFM